MSDLDTIRGDCWEKAVHTFGTHYIFQNRARRLQRRLRLLRFLGIAVPASVGGFIFSFGADSAWTPRLIWLAGVLSLVLLILSIWSLVAHWDDEFAYSQESLSANRHLYERYRNLGKNPPDDIAEARIQRRLLDLENQMRSTRDEAHHISDNEKRMGMRAALRQIQKACAVCEQVPTSMEPTQCDVCGNFKVPRI